VGANSGIPRIVTRAGWCWTTVSATAPPSPPPDTASSAVTIPAVSRAAATTAPVSNGFTVGIDSTRAEIPSVASCSAAAIARHSTVPLLISVTSSPARTVIARPSRNS